jgi:hypothetical protein
LHPIDSSFFCKDFPKIIVISRPVEEEKGLPQQPSLFHKSTPLAIHAAEKSSLHHRE